MKSGVFKVLKHRGSVKIACMKNLVHLYQPTCWRQSQHCSEPNNMDWQPKNWLWNQYSIHHCGSLSKQCFLFALLLCSDGIQNQFPEIYSFHKSPLFCTRPPEGHGRTIVVSCPFACNAILWSLIVPANSSLDVWAKTYQCYMQ